MSPDPVETPRHASAADVPRDLADQVRQGSAALEAGDLAGALASFEQVVLAFPSRPEGHNNLGALYSSLGELEKAEACFNRVLGILPGNPNIHYNRGLIRARQERFAEARLDFEAVLAHEPDDPDARNNLGVAAYLEGEPDEARLHFNRVLEVRPGHTNALMNLCDLEADVGDAPRAIGACETFLARDDDPVVRRKLLELCATSAAAHLDRACLEAETLLGEGPDDADLRRDLGRLISARSALAGTAGT